MKILLHGCCAACLIAPYRFLRESGEDAVAFFYNPNIMPYREFRSRLACFKDYTTSQNISNIYDENYPLEYMLKKYLEPGEKSRCQLCYEIRLNETARIAAEKDFNAFSTTLLVSPYQDHDLIRKAGEEAGFRYHVHFIFRDWRPDFLSSHEEAKQRNLYLQSYCGCIFSEEERYRKRKNPPS